ncbi:LysM peptidoglycan-binding domain-containing protein [Halanaerobium salsuginis]|jgi:LysM repeat protein|uniref:LysM domain-containing protein n=1 Tax=Halanaerobium salsuginis TaxID=29563 RepID=A0A1I4F4H8_9FIRM|nr:LysM peptidoglycan-binding domain-containing protein [Halanaerobium salsuginis]SFL12180.1 LysM domain-containing protein [Halanaerobium salsuginis]
MQNINNYSLHYQVKVKDKGLFVGLSGKKLIKVKLIKMILSILSLALIITILFSFIGAGENTNSFISYEVQKGESIWSIAAQYYGPQVDLRKAVYRIKQFNKISSAVIVPGQILTIPLD